MITMNIRKMNKLILVLSFIAVTSCSLSPGMYFKSDFQENKKEFVYLDDNKQTSIPVEPINLDLITKLSIGKPVPYKIGVGDGLVVTIWGLPETFPMNSINNETNTRIVNTDGTIFFPYVGEVNALGKTQVELRNILTDGLSVFFTDPQLDVSISKFNSQKIYILGEVTKPMKVFLTETPLSLTDALGESLGLKTETSAANEVFIIRSRDNGNPQVFKADMSSPAGYIVAGEFILKPEDVIYVNAKGTTRWNRVISQFFPFSTLLNSVNNLVED
tara:strand:- start:820 stop:1641 length:822 start_codon:yes stop_codon:yes gene_type:complete